ncbi:MAG TPA: AMP-binding protein, partial [Solirubrobacteraceae bacterium]|nr:AMP-binding protein [Solirubrobacteraceae bacterium]
MIIEDVDRHAREQPGARAVVEVGADGRIRELAWAELAKQSTRVAQALVSLGVQPGENVAFQLPNRLEFVAIALGTLRAGAVCEPLMPIFRERELEFMLRESGARVLFVPGVFRGRDYTATAAGVRSTLPDLEHVLDTSDIGTYPYDTGTYQSPKRSPADIAQLLFTSGTSGEPKGALHRHDVL